MERGTAQVLYKAIYERRSVRRYNNQTVDEQIMQDIITFAEDTVLRLYPEIRTALDIVPPSEVGKLGVVKAPHFLLFYTDKGADDVQHLLNAGFFLQHLDLYLHTLGLGRCWLGLARPKQRSKDGLAHCITLAFGYTDDELTRPSSDFKRKSLSQMSTGDDPRLEAARLAPSAVNSQTWFFAAHNQSIDVYQAVVSPLKKRLYGVMNSIDMGIALCHLQLASLHYQMSYQYRILPPEEAPHKENFEYLATI